MLPFGFFASEDATYYVNATEYIIQMVLSTFIGLAIIKVYEVFGSKS